MKAALNSFTSKEAAVGEMAPKIDIYEENKRLNLQLQAEKLINLEKLDHKIKVLSTSYRGLGPQQRKGIDGRLKPIEEKKMIQADRLVENLVKKIIQDDQLVGSLEPLSSCSVDVPSELEKSKQSFAPQ